MSGIAYIDTVSPFDWELSDWALFDWELFDWALFDWKFDCTLDSAAAKTFDWVFDWTEMGEYSSLVFDWGVLTLLPPTLPTPLTFTLSAPLTLARRPGNAYIGLWVSPLAPPPFPLTTPPLPLSCIPNALLTLARRVGRVYIGLWALSFSLGDFSLLLVVGRKVGIVSVSMVDLVVMLKSKVLGWLVGWLVGWLMY